MNRILIVDDDALSRDKLRSLIDFKKCGYMIVGEAKSGREAIGLIEKLKPDVIITDIVMQNINGIELIEFIQKNYPDVVVIALSAYDDYCYVRDGLKLGAKDYLLKHTLTSESLLKF
jgi:two-component system response regulator YesN